MVKKGRIFDIELSCDFEYLWRYNITLACEMLGEQGERLDFGSKELRVADIGSQMRVAPEGWTKRQKLQLSTVRCASIRMVAYLLAHTMPEERDVESLKPFEMRIMVTTDGEKIYNKVHYVDQRGGAAINIVLP